MKSILAATTALTLATSASATPQDTDFINRVIAGLTQHGFNNIEVAPEGDETVAIADLDGVGYEFVFDTESESLVFAAELSDEDDEEEGDGDEEDGDYDDDDEDHHDDDDADDEDGDDLDDESDEGDEGDEDADEDEDDGDEDDDDGDEDDEDDEDGDDDEGSDDT